MMKMILIRLDRLILEWALIFWRKVSREADVILNGSLKGLIQLMRLTGNNRLCYNISLIGAFGFNSLGILTACGILYPLTKTLLHPMIPIAVMSTSSLCLIINIAVFKYLGTRAIKNIDRVLSKLVQNSLFSWRPVSSNN